MTELVINSFLFPVPQDFIDVMTGKLVKAPKRPRTRKRGPVETTPAAPAKPKPRKKKPAKSMPEGVIILD